MTGLRISPFISMMITLLFMFSTAYGLMFYYYQAESKTITTSGMPITPNDDPNNPSSLNTNGGFFAVFVSGIIDTLLSLLAWISPFAAVRWLFFVISPTDLFNVLDIFLLRPMSWTVTILTANWILAKVRGTSEGT